MGVGVGPGVTGEKTGQEIAIGKGGLISKSDHDEVEGGYHIEALLFRPDAGNEIAWAAGIELIAVDGQLQDGNGLEPGHRRRAVKPEADPISRIGSVACN